MVPDGRSRSPQRPRATKRGLTASTLLAGFLVGTMEGWIYPGATGPRAPLYSYWALMIGVLFLTLVGALSWFTHDPVPRRVLVGLALALLPFALVVQDAASLVGQGQVPWTADWYRVAFGESPLTRHYGGLPGWYYGATVLTLALVSAVARALPRAKTVEA